MTVWPQPVRRPDVLQSPVVSSRPHLVLRPWSMMLVGCRRVVGAAVGEGFRVRFLLLGPPRFGTSDDGVVLGARGNKVLAALLLDVNSVVPVQRLIDVLWDDAPPAGAVKISRNCVWLVRSALTAAGLPGVVETTAGGYRLVMPSAEIDVWVFRDGLREADRLLVAGSTDAATALLQRCLALWRGPALSGLGSRAFVPVSAHLEEQRLAAWETLADIELAAGRHGGLVAALTELVRTYPSRERLVGRLMVALYRSGRRVDALAEYGRVRAQMVQDLGLEPSAFLTDLHDQILRSDLILPVERGTGAYAIDADPVESVPRQLPAYVSDFSGRVAELAELDRLLGQVAAGAPVVISAISGMGGVGKTSLAVWWAHLARSRLPDGDLYIDLQGYHPTSRPLPPGEVLGRFLRALGVAGEGVPADLGERVALYRTMMFGRRMLVVLDNAANAAQIRPLLPASPGCVVLVTSRDRLSGLVVRDGARSLVLDVLSTDDALRLLRRVVGDHGNTAPGAAAALVELCGFLPLAIRIVAERIQADAGATIAGAVAELSDRRNRLGHLAIDDDPTTTLRSVLGWSYERLNRPAQTLFRLLGLAEGPDFAAGAAAALLGMPERTTLVHLSALVRTHLLQVDGDRYRMHDLIRLLARELADGRGDDADPYPARRRLLTWYLRAATSARIALDPYLPPMPQRPDDPAVVTPTFDTPAAALVWCEDERVNIVAAAQSAQSLTIHDIAWQLPTALYPFFDLRKYDEDWITTHTAATTAAQALGDHEAEGRIWCNLGNAYRPQGRTAEASECYLKALALFDVCGYRQGAAKVLGNLASTYNDLRLTGEALDYGARAVTAFDELGDVYGEALSLTNRGRSLEHAGRLDEAVEHHHAPTRCSSRSTTSAVRPAPSATSDRPRSCWAHPRKQCD